VLTLVDCMPFVEVERMEYWLDVAAALIRSTRDLPLKNKLNERIWEVVSTEMDVETATVAAQWWMRDGRRRVEGEASNPARL